MLRIDRQQSLSMNCCITPVWQIAAADLRQLCIDQRQEETTVVYYCTITTRLPLCCPVEQVPVTSTTVWPDVTHHHGGNCRLNSSPKGDAQEAHCRQSTAGQQSQSSSFVFSNNNFYRATSIHSADYAVAKCLSVCPSVTGRYCV